jgi:hypothetical protein
MLSVDMTTFMESMLDWAGQMFNALIPIVAIVIGISFGVGLIFLIKNLLGSVLNKF